MIRWLIGHGYPQSDRVFNTLLQSPDFTKAIAAFIGAHDYEPANIRTRRHTEVGIMQDGFYITQREPEPPGASNES